MDFKVGDKVVHWAHGPGEVIQVEDKSLAGQTVRYYAVRVKDLVIWVPVSGVEISSLRPPTPPVEFSHLYTILSGAGDPVLEDRLQRKSQLSERLRDGRLESICRVIRDLSFYGHKKKLSESDSQILERARSFLLDEWRLSLSTSLEQAQKELERLLDEGWSLAHN
jgi:RNA polymerase-interacting CarD/CdnL/TRCF family regulator